MKRSLICAALLLQGCAVSATWDIDDDSHYTSRERGTVKLVYSYFNGIVDPQIDTWDNYRIASERCEKWGWWKRPYVPNAVQLTPVTKVCGYNPNGSAPIGQGRSCVVWYVSQHWKCQTPTKLPEYFSSPRSS